jgi:hypothetical protein
MSLASKVLTKRLRDMLSVAGLERRLLRSKPTEGRIGKHVAGELAKRTGRPISELLGLARKGVLSAPPLIRGIAQGLLQKGAGLGASIKSAAGKFTHPVWAKFTDAHWAAVLEAAIFQKERGNVIGRVRELIREEDERFGVLTNRVAAKVAKANAGARGEWLDPTHVRGALQYGEGMRADELGDILKISIANPKENLPRIKGKNKRLWIMAIVESKSPSNFKDAFDQLTKDVKRIRTEGISIHGEYFSPDEIHIELPKPGTLPKDAVTELIAAIPEAPANSIAGERALAAAQKVASIQVWSENVPEKEIVAAGNLASELAASLK